MKIKISLSQNNHYVGKILAIFLIAVMIVTVTPQSLLQIVGVKTEAKAAVTLSNPRIVANSSMISGQIVTWDCIWFGSYPQTEIVDQAENSGCYGKPWSSSSNYEVDASLYAALQAATFDSKGETTIEGTKYRRIKESDAINHLLSGDESMFNWADSDSYHYFRYDPIKWRVLNVNGSQALLLADLVLDNQKYSSTIWESSIMRSWLNGYDSYSSKNFIDSAFTSSQKKAIISTSVINEDNITYGTDGGNDTNDKIFLLSESETYNTDKAKSYGFSTDGASSDEAKTAKSSTFAKAMGILSYSGYGYAYDDDLGVCIWLLRSPGYEEGFVTEVGMGGSINEQGMSIGYHLSGCRPALNLDLSNSELFFSAGTVCSDVIHRNREIRNAKEATCKEEGYTGDTYCTDCGLKISEGETIPKLTYHQWDLFGTITKQPTTTEWGTKVHTCKVCGATKTENLEPIEEVDNEETIVVKLPKPYLSSVKNIKKRKLLIKWRKNSILSGFVIQISTNKSFKTATINKIVKSGKKGSLQISKLKKNKTYYVRIRSYVNLEGDNYYSSWSKVKKVKIKK